MNRDLDFTVKIGNLTLKNPVILASGTAGYGFEISKFIDLSEIGAIVTKSISLKPRKGNPPQRIVETPSGMLNSIGLANIGLDLFISEKIPFLKSTGTTIICNIAASSVEEYKEVAKELDSEEAIAALEINVSCPNVKDGGLIFGNDINLVRKITEEVRCVTKKTIIIKLSPNVSKISDFALAAKEGGADAVSAINTLVGTTFDIWTRKPKINMVTGGLSGPAIRPVALAKVLEIRRNVEIDIIGIGGITEWKDGIEFMIAGANAFQIGTINFVNPKAAPEILTGLSDYCNKMKIKKVRELTGSYIL
ncbi:MAG: dihydroorotate dehydrogenase [Ignavibacteriales bacterium]|nr:dihydroorotate dehydrogenase [Ignavibacteriales bacterium]